AGTFSPWLGESYENLARRGLSFQRSQTSGRFVVAPGPVVERYKRVGSRVGAPVRETGFFDGIDTRLPALFQTLGRPAPAGAAEALAALERETAAALAAFRVEDPNASVPALARALAAARRAREASASEPDAAFVLETKERQVMDALEAALGLELVATAQPPGIPDPGGPYAAFVPPPVMDAPVPGQSFEVRTRLTNRGRGSVTPKEIVLVPSPGFEVTPGAAPLADLATGTSASRRFTVRVADD